MNHNGNDLSDLELNIWKQNERKTADIELRKLIDQSSLPEDRSASLNALIVAVANVNDPAVTTFYAIQLAKLKILKQKNFKDRVTAAVIAPGKLGEIKVNSLNPSHAASKLLEKYPMIFFNERFYIYNDGVFRQMVETELAALIKKQIGNKYSTFLLKEIKSTLQAETFKHAKELNQDFNLLNVRNGMLNIEKMELKPHNPSYLNTIQLDCDYDGEETCPKWVKFLEETLGDDPVKVDILQEFFGYCLTPVTNQEKAIVMVGDGANGKSTILSVLQGFFGKGNVEGVSLEQFNNSHYMARLFGCMVNISSESNTKTKVYESNFKKIITGDLISADQKYGHPFSFNNTCKLIFAVNTLPRIDDKTDAFYRRLLLIPFNRQIPEEKQNKNLGKELLEEKAGILNWALHGLQRLKSHGRFSESQQAKDLLADYRKENNNVIGFVEERCDLDPNAIISKSELYQEYKNYCTENGYSSLGMIRFGKQLRKQFPNVMDESGTNNEKLWMGISEK